MALGCLMLDCSDAPLFRLRLLWRLAVPALNTLLLRCSDTPASYSPIRFSGAWLTTPLVLWSTVLGCLWRSPALDGSNTRPLRHTPLGVLQQAPLLSTSRSALPRSTSPALGLSCAGHSALRGQIWHWACPTLGSLAFGRSSARSSAQPLWRLPAPAICQSVGLSGPRCSASTALGRSGAEIFSALSCSGSWSFQVLGFFGARRVPCYITLILSAPLLDCPGSRSTLSATRRSSALGPFAHRSGPRLLLCLTSPALDGSNTRPLRHTPLGVLQQAPLLSTSRSALPRSTSSALGLSCAGLFLPSTLSDALLRPVPVLGAWLFHFDLFVLPCSLIESLIDVVY